jgi:hypothetical protein
VKTDEQVKVEATTSEETQEQTSDEEVNGSEAENTQETENTTNESDRGDLRVPLKEERTKRQELEAQLNDPEFIYQKAQELGLTQAEAREAVENKEERGMSYKDYKYFSEIDRAQEKYPQLKKNESLQYSVTAHINKGMSPLKAADKVFSEIQKETEELAKQRLDEKKQEEIEQEKASNVSSTSTSTAESAEIEQLKRDSKSLDRKTQEKAMIKLMQLKEKRTER